MKGDRESSQERTRVRSMRERMQDVLVSATVPIMGAESTMTDYLTAVTRPAISESLTAWAAHRAQQPLDIGQAALRAGQYLEKAGTLVSELEAELQRRSRELEAMASSIASMKTETDNLGHYTSADQELVDALLSDVEPRIRRQVRLEMERNQGRRRLWAVLLWVFTLLAGAIAGAIALYWWQTARLPP